MPDPRPIGIFDSGVGGLTVFAEIRKHLPGESTIYLGDTARVPYGTKSPETVIRYARHCARLLCERDIKLLVVACNTASAFALEALSEELPIPVVGVVAPGAAAAVGISRNGRIGIIGTRGTIGSGAYQRAIADRQPEATVHSQACPLFVPLAEEGWVNGTVAEAIARNYLADLLGEGIDTLVLGCTHYPLLKGTLAAVCGPAVTLVDSAEETSKAVARKLDAKALRAPDGHIVAERFLVSDSPDSFAAIGKQFLQRDFGAIEWVDC